MGSIAFIHEWAGKPLVGLLFVVVCITAGSYYGQAEIFDPIILGAVVTLAFLFKRNVNLWTLLSIFIFARALDEIFILFLNNTLVVKIPLYATLAIVIHYFSRSYFKAYLFVFLIVACACEFYWWLTAYDAPEIYWPTFLLILTAFAKHAIMMRSIWCFKVLRNFELKVISLDFKFQKSLVWVVVIYSVYTFEYYIRHLLGFQNVLFIYGIFPYLMQAYSLFVVYMFFVEAIKQLSITDLSA